MVNAITFLVTSVYLGVSRNWFSYHCPRKLCKSFSLKLTYKLFAVVFWQMMKLIPYAIKNLLVRGKNLWSKNHARSENVQRFSPTPFTHDSLVSHTLHDLKAAISSQKYQIFHLNSIYRFTAKFVLFLAQTAGTRSVYCYIMQSANSSENSS